MDITTTGSGKPWYKKSENLIGAPIVGLGLAALAVYVGVQVLPFVILALTNTLYTALLFGAVAGLTFIALDPNVHTAVYYTWKSITRSIGNAIINHDPIGVIETSIKIMQSRLDEMVQGKADVGGQLKGLQAKIKANNERAELNMRKAQVAEKSGRENDVKLMAMEAQQLVLSNQNLTETKNKIELMYRVLDKMVDTVDFNIKKTRSELEIKKEERKAIMSAHAGMVKGWKVIGGSGPEAEMFNRAMENIAETAHRQLAEIDDIMDLSQGIINGVDLEKGVIQQDALKMLEQWEKHGSSALLGSDKAVLVSKANDTTQVIDVTPKQKVLANATTTKGKSKFADLLNNKS